MMLFSYKIIYINDYEEQRQDQIIQELEGNKFQTLEGVEETCIDQNLQALQKQSYIMRARDKNGNPVKEGLSDNTLLIMKACLKVIKESHLKHIGENGSQSNMFYIPTVCVLEEMKKFLMIQEQINAVLFGISYTKREDFFQDQDFNKLVEILVYYEERDQILDIGSQKEEDLGILKHEDSTQLQDSKTQMVRKEITEDRKIHWENCLKKFLTKSNEKWILDQFNLCKKFLNQNSIMGHYDDFSDPVYEEFSHIVSMKKKCSDREQMLKLQKRFTTLVKTHSVDLASGTNNLDDIPVHRISDVDLTVLKCDIDALLRTIEEIENKVRMNKILSHSGKNSVKRNLEKEAKMKDRFIREQFSMLNFGKNFMAVDYSLKNPSDERNKFSLRR